MPYTDQKLREIWRAQGGKFHGPNVETGCMPEHKLLPFLRSLFEIADVKQGGHHD